MFRKMPFLLIALIALVLFFGSSIPLSIKQVFYAISLSIKSVIIFLLPLIIFGLLFKVSVNLARNATKVILLLLIAVCVSNFLSTLLSHGIGAWVYSFDLPLVTPAGLHSLEPYWTFELPKILPNDLAMFSGLGAGILMSFFKASLAEQWSKKIETFISQLLTGFIYFIPLFIAGFVIKLQADGVIHLIIRDYALIFTVIAASQFIYIAFIYLLANSLNFSAFLNAFKNMLPAAVTGFCTMSSAAAMPLTLIGTEKNSSHKDLAKSIIPATVNIHLIGDCFAIPIFAYAILKNYGIAEPTFLSYLTFALYFVLAKFSVAAIPGGGILVMLPILESHLGFNAEMMSLITALYILFDPVITSANVLGNGGFAMVFGKLRAWKTRSTSP